MPRGHILDLRWDALLRDFRRSGLTHAEFCRRRGISIHSFRKRLYRAVTPKPTPADRPSSDLLATRFLPVTIPGATNTGTFETYVEEVRVPELKPGDVVVWDNLKPHQSEEAIEAVEEAGAEVVPLPPYSPDYTPIEEMFSKVKGAMRSAAGRTKDAVYAAFGSVLHNVTPKDIAGWFQDRAAYAMQL
jgi:transposase